MESLDGQVKEKFSSRFSVVCHLRDALLLLALSKLFAVRERLVSMVISRPHKHVLTSIERTKMLALFCPSFFAQSH